MTRVVEIARIASSEAYRNDPSIINPSLEVLAKTKGTQAVYHGLEHEDKNTIFLIVVWDSIDDHKAIINDKENYDKLIAGLAICGTSKPEVIHAPLAADPFPQFKAPATEFAFLTLKAGKDAKDLKLVLASAFPGSGKTPEGTHGGSFAQSVEKEDLYLLVIGWDSVELHWKSIQENEAIKTFVTTLKELTEVDVKHASLTAYKTKE